VALVKTDEAAAGVDGSLAGSRAHRCGLEGACAR